MLDTQVKYWTLQETKRHNIATEALTAEQNQQGWQNIEIQWFNAKESKRHNKIGEKVSWFNAKETKRHNIVNEKVAWANMKEGKRHNLVTESQGWANLDLGNRTLAETNRHNVASEAIGRTQAGAAVMSAQAAQVQAAAAQRNAATNFLEYGIDVSRKDAYVTNLNAQTNLYGEQAKTESSKRLKNESSAYADLSGVKQGYYNILNNAVGNFNSAMPGISIRKNVK